MLSRILIETTLKLSEMRSKYSVMVAGIIQDKLDEILDYFSNFNELKKEDIAHIKAINNVVLIEILVFVKNNSNLEQEELKEYCSRITNRSFFNVYNNFTSNQTPLEQQIQDEIISLKKDLKYLTDFENKLTDEKLKELVLFLDSALALFVMIYWKFGFNGKYFNSKKDEELFISGIFQELSNMHFFMSLGKEEMTKLFFEISVKNDMADFERNIKLMIGEVLSS